MTNLPVNDKLEAIVNFASRKILGFVTDCGMEIAKAELTTDSKLILSAQISAMVRSLSIFVVAVANQDIKDALRISESVSTAIKNDISEICDKARRTLN